MKAIIFYFYESIHHAKDSNTYFAAVFPEPIGNQLDVARMRFLDYKEDLVVLDVLSSGNGEVAFFAEGDNSEWGFNTASLDELKPKPANADDEGQAFGWSRKGSNFFKGAMVPSVFSAYMDKLTMNFNTDAAKESENLYNTWHGTLLMEEKLDDTFGGRTVNVNFFQRHKDTAKERHGAPCGWKSEEECNEEMQRWGDMCCVGGTLHEDIPVNFDRFVNAVEDGTKTPHDKENCTVMSVQLNLAKNAHGAFKSKETLRLFCEKKRINPELGKVAITRLVFEPFLKSLIRRHVELNHHRLKLPACMLPKEKE